MGQRRKEEELGPSIERHARLWERVTVSRRYKERVTVSRECVCNG